MRNVVILTTVCAIAPGFLGLVGCAGEDSGRGVSSHYPQPAYEGYRASGRAGATGGAGSGSSYSGGATRPAGSAYQSVTTSRIAPRKSPTSLLTEVRVRKDFLPSNARGRRGQRSMRPRYITIHSTQNWSKGADAWRHSLALKRSKLGKLAWHFTTDDKVAVQHLPTNITGRHADFDGPGNRYSIGIEMCEHPGSSRARTVDRTAKLAAYLMYKHDIPLARVVPHYHWPRYGMSPAHKNCPHFLLDNGRPGRKWRGFQARVKSYHDQITKSGDVYVSR